jgi:hypothetical protein
LRLIAVSFVLFGLGFGFFFSYLASDFSDPGMGNRFDIASALGAACVWIAAVGLVCALLRNDAYRAKAFSVGIGMICGANSLAVCGIAHTWQAAASQQSLILKSVSEHVSALPHGSVLLLDGFCQSLGYTQVLYSNDDTSSALQAALHDDSLQGDVISRDAQFQPEAVDMTLYGEPEGHYPYGNRLFVYNVRYQTLKNLPSKQSAIQYLQAMNPTGDSGCPFAAD